MSHNINEDRVMTVGTAWHGIGQVVEEAQTSADAIRLAKLDYAVNLADAGVYVNGEWISLDDKRFIIREDTKEVLSPASVTDHYKLFQNVEAFDFFDSIVGEKLAMYHSAGALGKGEAVFISAKLPNSFTVKGQEVEKYLLLANFHDGKRSLRMFFTPVRVVCQNTLNAAFSGAQKEGIKIAHKGDLASKVKAAQEALGIARKYYDTLETAFGSFADFQMTEAQVEDYLEAIFGKSETTRSTNIREKVTDLVTTSPGNDVEGVRGTLWAAYNGITYYADHEMTVRKEEENPSNRANSVLFGTASRLKQKALEEALALVEA